jgi:hypothetical protein
LGSDFIPIPPLNHQPDLDIFFMKRIALGIIAAALTGCSASPTSQPSTDPKPATNQKESECPYGKHFWTGTCKTQKEVQSDAITWDNPKDLNNGK